MVRCSHDALDASSVAQRGRTQHGANTAQRNWEFNIYERPREEARRTPRTYLCIYFVLMHFARTLQLSISTKVNFSPMTRWPLPLFRRHSAIYCTRGKVSYAKYGKFGAAFRQYMWDLFLRWIIYRHPKGDYNTFFGMFTFLSEIYDWVIFLMI